MSNKEKNFSRRDFFKITGAAGVGSIAATVGTLSNASNKPELKPSEPRIVPTRTFGKTGVNVPILALGGSRDLMSKPLLLRQAMILGVTYWDTAHTYSRGKSEEAIGKYFTRYPEERKKVFLVTKSTASVPNEMTQHLDISLERLKTSYVDLFFIHKFELG